MEIRRIDDSSAEIRVDRTLYSEEVVHKCFYWYGDKYCVDIKSEPNFLIIHLKDKSNEGAIDKIFPKIKSDIIDFKTRSIVSMETRYIREILIAKAFARDNELEEKPLGDIADPVGFNPLF